MIKIVRYIPVLGILVLFACSVEGPEDSNEKIFTPVHVMEAHKQQRQEKYTLMGTIKINREMRVGFKLPGRITHMAFEEGQEVREGSLLAQLDTAELLARKEKAIEGLKKAKRDLDRMEKLFRQKIVPETSLQDAQSAYNLSSAELKIVEDAVKNSSITAPFKGRIIKKLAEEGEVIGQGTVIALLAEMDPILIKAAIPDHLIPRIDVGETAFIKVDWEPDRYFKGLVHRMESMADPVTRTLGIEIMVANPDETLKPGLFAQVEIRQKEKEWGIYLPLDAVMGYGKEPFIFVVNDHVAQKREIKTGRIIQQDVEIIAGLSPGETVVISGQEYLRDEQPVIIKDRTESSP